jgi:phage minor structural protein
MITFEGGVIRTNNWYIKELSSGLDELVFTISIYDPMYPALQEEATLTERDAEGANLYQIKAIDGGGDTATIKAVVDLDDWRSSFTASYAQTQITPSALVSAVLPSGWTMQDNSGIAFSRPIELEGVTAYDILEAARDVFEGLTYKFDALNKKITLLSTTGGQNLGAFVAKDLNLKRNNYKGKSTGLITRLYAVGKDGITFSGINGGKSYIEDHTYSARTICGYLKDDRAETAEILLAEARATLSEACVPSRSYDCDVVDLAAADPDRFGYLSFPLFSVVGLIDTTRANTKINHRVVERWRYPDHPEKNKVVLSTVPPRIQSQVQQIGNSINNINSAWQQKQQAMQDTLTAALLGARGGAVRMLDTDGDGTLDTLYIADNADPAQAEKVWRFNYEGWGASTNGYSGPFVLGATFTDGGTLFANVLKIVNIDASSITTGTLNAENINVTNINGANIKDNTVADGKITRSTLTSGAMSSGVNTSLAGGAQAVDVFNNGVMATFGNFSTLLVQGHQFTEQQISLTNGSGVVQTFTLLALVQE